MNEFQIEVLRQVVGHCSHNIGWNGIHSSSLDLLTEVLQKYLTEMGYSLHRYSEQFGRTVPNLDDLGLAFRDMGISIPDLSDYVCNVEPAPFNEDISEIPIPREHALNFLKPGSHEVLSRPVHIHEHLPPMQHIILGEDKVSGDETEIAESIAIQDSAEQNIGLSPPSYSFKRPDCAEKRKGGWLGDDGQPIREISSVMITTSGYLSSSREGKLPDTKIRKVYLETEIDHFPSPEKKINIKKVLEGVKKADESSRKCDDKDSDLLKKFNEIIKDREIENEEGKQLQIEQTKEVNVEKEGKRERNKDKERVKEQEKEREIEKEREKEKIEKDKTVAKEIEKEKMKKKRNKEKLLEEFAFFEKEKSTSFKPLESNTPVDSTKQKLNIFKKLSKTKDMDNQTSRIAASSTHRAFTETNDSEKGSNASFDEVAFKGFSDTRDLSSISEAFSNEKAKGSKKERKLKNKKDRYVIPEVGIADGQVKGRLPGTDFCIGDSADSKEETMLQNDSASSAKLSQNKLKTVTGHGVDIPKKKRGRPSRMITPEVGDTQISEIVPPVHVESPIPSIPKSFFPFSPHFPVPGLIPQQGFIPNVPFNLLGVPPLGLRSPLGISSNMLTGVGSLASNVSSPDLCTTPKGESVNKVPPLPSPTTKSPNIVDSLPESSLNVDTSEGDSGVSKKKEKRDKKEKDKKKKEKKIKAKDSDEQERKAKREKKKEKKEKDKDKSKEKEEIIVPKITFKFAAAPTSPNPSTPDSTPKLIFKALAGREGNFTSAGSGNRDVISQSPMQSSVEVAKFSALVTRPPKLVKSLKEIPANKLSSETSSETPSTSQAVPGSPRTPSPSPKVRREKPQKPPRVTKEKEKEKKKCDKLGVGDVAVITETVGSYYDEFGNKIWICPACGRQDDGTPMIGCDECDDWYHWVCVGIRVPPAETESWFCQRCIAKKQGSLKDGKRGRKKKSV